MQKLFSMQESFLKGIILLATTLTGLLCGASLDQSIKQLPARRIIGVKAFSEYAKAADLKNGVAWYGILGIGAALSSLITAILTWIYYPTADYSIPIFLSGAFAICHSICTTFAAPAYHKQKKIEAEDELKKLFNRFERIQTLRSVFIVLNFLCFIWALKNLL